jgi:hypothetical protein
MQVVATLSDEYGHPSICLTYGDGERQSIAPAGSTITDLLDQVERVARWKGDGNQNPFAELRSRVAASKN